MRLKNKIVKSSKRNIKKKVYISCDGFSKHFTMPKCHNCPNNVLDGSARCPSCRNRFNEQQRRKRQKKRQASEPERRQTNIAERDGSQENDVKWTVQYRLEANKTRGHDDKDYSTPTIGERVVAGQYFDAGRAFMCLRDDIESAFVSEGGVPVTTFAEWSQVITKLVCHTLKVNPAVAEDLLDYHAFMARLDAHCEWRTLRQLDAEWRRKISLRQGHPFKYASIDATL